jgi:hypothetical protein
VLTAVNVAFYQNLEDAVVNSIVVSGYERAQLYSARYVEENRRDRRQIYSNGI